ncbi:MAG: hypothetical protein ACI4DU_02605, partial [Lachnospiraceae bacterium]
RQKSSGNREYKSDVISMIYNINSGNNESLLAKSKVLRGYMSFVNRVRENLALQMEAGEEKNLEYAIDEAIDYCIKNHIMEEFFNENRDEVKKNMVLDYTWERREQLIREEEYEEGRQTGFEQGIEQGIALGEERLNEEKERHIRNLMNSLQIDEKKAKELLGIETNE